MDENCQGAWAIGGHTKEFDPNSGLLTLSFEWDEEITSNDHDDDILQVPSPPHDIPISSVLLPTEDFTFTEDHYF